LGKTAAPDRHGREAAQQFVIGFGRPSLDRPEDRELAIAPRATGHHRADQTHFVEQRIRE